VLKIASEAGLNINWKKCRFLLIKIKFLGHITENSRIYPSTQKTEAIRKFLKPSNIKQIQNFLD